MAPQQQRPSQSADRNKVAQVHSRVTYKYDNGVVHTRTIVERGKYEGYKIKKNKRAMQESVINTSPIGKAMLGKRGGDTVTVHIGMDYLDRFEITLLSVI